MLETIVTSLILVFICGVLLALAPYALLWFVRRAECLLKTIRRALEGTIDPQ